MKRHALLSVTDKTGIADFARGLRELGFELLSTGGTRKAIADAGIPVREVAEHTGFPEMMDGRIKTLHPKVHGGLLSVRDDPGHQAAMREHGIAPIDLLCVNLYRFGETVRRPGATRADIVENIDIGGPAMVRSAAKNHAHVAVVVDPQDYPAVLAALRAHDGRLPEAQARALAAKAFALTAAYDTAIAAWFDHERRAQPDQPRFPARLAVAGDKLQDLRYGENPHQQAAFYAFSDQTAPSLASSRQLGGKELSYNNILDCDAALAAVLEHAAPAVVIVKHNNPCGVAVAGTQPRAFELALRSDPVSAFGGILAVNRPLDPATAAAIVQSGTFVECLVAPAVSAAALAELQRAKWGSSVRVLDLGGLPSAPERERAVLRQVNGGFLVQTPDQPVAPPEHAVMTTRAPTAAEDQALRFAWLVCKHVKSNAIVLATTEPDGAFGTVGIGAGQMSRVDAARIAVHKAGTRAPGSVLASDAFFPFPDGLQLCIDAGVTAAIQPGGSKRDADVTAAADHANLAMIRTGHRHFRH